MGLQILESIRELEESDYYLRAREKGCENVILETFEQSMANLKKNIEELSHFAQLAMRMIQDKEYKAPEETQRILKAGLLYLVDEEDIINDRTPIIGYLDDAIVLGRVLNHAKDELKRYESFLATHKKH
jgi:uncharacterized membrane protein YkvA (DUF1232 family)